VVQFITIEELLPSAPELPDPGLPAPPPPIVTAPRAVLPHTGILSIFLKPPAPPPPAPPPLPDGPEPPPPPPPATINVLTSLVPGCVVTALGVLDVLTVCVFLPRDVMLIGPIIPPFAIAYSTSYASSNNSYDTK
jgi:hypothetical protein